MGKLHPYISMTEQPKKQEVEELAPTAVKKERAKKVKVAKDKPISIPVHVYQCMELMGEIDTKIPNARCFYDANGAVYLGILFVETPDSFLVGAPIRLVREDGNRVLAESLTAEPIVRIFKNSLDRISSVVPTSLYIYYRFLLEVGTKILPDYVTGEHKSVMETYLKNFEANENFIGSMPKIETPGASEHSFRSLIENKNIH